MFKSRFFNTVLLVVVTGLLFDSNTQAQKKVDYDESLYSALEYRSIGPFRGGRSAAVAGVPVKDTIKAVSPQQVVVDTPDRQGLWAAQTPQIFRYDLLLDAHQHCTGTVTDDAAMVESLGHTVKMFLGSYENLKVTTPEDLAVAEVFLRARTGIL